MAANWGILGIAAAFYLGFKNNSSYDRTSWEARKIWGSIVNNSRSFAAAVVSFVQTEDPNKTAQIKRILIHRHVAWLTALRYQMRLSKEWEHVFRRVKGLYIPTICEDYFQKSNTNSPEFLTEEEISSVLKKSNMATQILALQSESLQTLRDDDCFDDFRHMEFQRLISELYNDQGKSERIKNFPFPRQYASTALWTTLVFCILLPFGLLNTFAQEESWMAWMTIPFSALITWIFFLMEKIGDYSENPFEGTYNDVPITSIAKGIEIDIREMINDTNIPKPIENQNGFLM
ncbi:MAG: bestrophin family ion channel [Bacteroidia bacterium]